MAKDEPKSRIHKPLITSPKTDEKSGKLNPIEQRDKLLKEAKKEKTPDYKEGYIDGVLDMANSRGRGDYANSHKRTLNNKASKNKTPLKCP